MNLFTTPRDFERKIALVTGAASGIGRALSLELARRGAHLVLVDVNEAGLADVARLIRDLGSEVATVGADLMSREGQALAATKSLAAFGRVDILVNNAGVMPLGPMRLMTLEDWERVTALNVWAPVRLTSAVLPGMLERGEGSIVNLSSVVGLIAPPGMTGYTMTKFAILGYSEALRAELESSGVAVTVVCPGVVRTNLGNAPAFGEGAMQRLSRTVIGLIGASPGRVARGIARAISKRKGRVNVGTLGTSLALLSRLSPSLAGGILSRLYRWMGLGK